MPHIKLLPIQEAQKIAAGQVVERPANIVKELIENSIDAHATSISVFIENGGKDLIRVVDNGCGMDHSDAKLCFEKHATSKIRSIDELPSLTTFGFRGEALASIAAVSTVTLSTKHAESDAIKITAHEGTMRDEPTASAQGTDIIVRNLFYNVPARAKFLKKQETETRHIVQVLQAMAFAYPHIHFQLHLDGKKVLNCPPQETMIQRTAQIWDATTAQHMLSVDAMRSDKAISISGAISNHQWFRYDRSCIFFLVNNRWVTNFKLGSALIKGYNNVLPHGRYPMAALSIMINPALIDINTHPRKEEIVFAHPRVVEQLIQESVTKALEKHVSKQITKSSSSIKPFIASSPKASFFSFTPAAYARTIDDMVPNVSKKASEVPLQKNTAPIAPITITETVPSQSAIAPISILEKSVDYTIIGQYAQTYILIEKNDGLYIVDQHAAHERILYEQFAARFENLPTINLMFPQIITLPSEDIALIEPHLNLFTQHGILCEPFSKDQLIIQSTPVHLKNCALDDLVKQTISWIKELQSIDTKEFEKQMHEKLRAQMACKAAVKAGDSLTLEQMKELLKDLSQTDNRMCCPHGRPTGWLIALDDIEKKFRRRV